MDPKLAEIYGTGKTAEADIEKLAAAELAEKLSASEEIDVNALTDEDVEALATEVLAAEQGGEGAQETAGDDTEAQEKVAEADYLGRVMAHAFVQETKEIEKKAAEEKKEEKKEEKDEKKEKKLPPFMKAKMSAGKVAKHLKGMDKKSSALDTLAERRAVEILEANNIDPETLKPVQEKTSATKEEVLSAAVDQKAWELLGQYGFKPAEQAKE
jgi:uncharacterized protein with gpF-like domain